jgi:hypothetical protein
MTATRKFVCCLVLPPLLFMVGCQKKKASLPPKTQAPTVAVVLPDELPLPQAPEDAPEPTVQQPPEPPPAKTKPKKPTRTTTSSAKKNPSAVPPPTAGGNQTVASLHPPKATSPEPGTALAAAVPSAQVTQQKEDTARMVESTENSLKGLNRTLSDDEKSMRSQIQSYLQQSRKATTDGDYERAFNLAKKAQLLAEALVKK